MFRWIGNWLAEVLPRELGLNERAILLYLYYRGNAHGTEVSTHLGMSIFKALRILHKLDERESGLAYVKRFAGEDMRVEDRGGARRFYYVLTPEGKEWVETNMTGFIGREDHRMI